MRTQHFESQSSGTTVSAANSQDNSYGSYAVNAPTIGATSTFTYDSSKSKVGTKSGKIVCANGEITNFTVDTPTLGAQANQHNRCYFWFNESWSGETLIRLDASGAPQPAEIRLNSSMLIELYSSGGTLRATGTVPVSTGQWVRIEWRHVPSTGASGEVEVRLYNNPDSTTPDDTISFSGFQTVSLVNGQTLFQTIGLVTAAGGSRTIWMDGFVWSHTTWPSTADWRSKIATQLPTGNATLVGTWTNGLTGMNADDGIVATFTTTTKQDVRSVTVGNFGFDTAIPSTLTNLGINSVGYEIEGSASTGGTARTLLLRSGVAGAIDDDTTTGGVLSLLGTPLAYARPGGGSWARADILNGVLQARFEGRQPNNTTSRTYQADYAKIFVEYHYEEPAPAVTIFPQNHIGKFAVERSYRY